MPRLKLISVFMALVLLSIAASAATAQDGVVAQPEELWEEFPLDSDKERPPPPEEQQAPAPEPEEGQSEPPEPAPEPAPAEPEPSAAESEGDGGLPVGLLALGALGVLALLLVVLLLARRRRKGAAKPESQAPATKRTEEPQVKPKRPEPAAAPVVKAKKPTPARAQPSTQAPKAKKPEAPVAEEKAVPTRGDKAAAVKTDPPAPDVTQKPAPAVMQKPAPDVTQKPTPVVEDKPAPVVAEKVTPPVEDKPAPTVTRKPPPAVEDKPAPTVVQKPTPAPPVPRDQPAPVAAQKPPPARDDKPAPTVVPKAKPEVPQPSKPEPAPPLPDDVIPFPSRPGRIGKRSAQPARQRALGYVSAADTDAQASDLDAQTEKIRAACVRNGFESVEVVRDFESHSGSDLERPGLTYAIERLEAGEASCLVVASLERLTRSAAHLGTLIDRLGESGIRLVVLDIQLDTGNPDGRLAAEALANVGTLERKSLDTRTRKGLQAAREARRSSGRPAVADRPALKDRIADMRARGMTLQAIADTLNSEGVPTLRGGSEWRPSSVQAAVGYKRPKRGARKSGNGSSSDVSNGGSQPG